MSTLAEKLRIACEANGLGVSGSSSVLLARLVKKKRPKGKKTTTSSPKKKMVCKNGVCKPMKTSPVKATNKGIRLSASYYFHSFAAVSSRTARRRSFKSHLDVAVSRRSRSWTELTANTPAGFCASEIVE
jgi:hypothetical protein